MSPRGSFLRALVRAILYVALTFPLMPVQLVAAGLGLRAARRLPRFYHGLCARLLGVDIVVTGQRTRASPALYVGNHTSYLDILVLGATIEGSFVAKAEIEGWPLFGWLARLQRTVFIERRRRQAGAHRDAIGRRLDSGDNLILFPEGTSGDGNRVLPFKSALFAVAERRVDDAPLMVQPFTVAYTSLDGLPLGRDWRPLVAWYGEMSLGGHLWRWLSLGRLGVEVHFHEPVTIETFGTRKALADHCREAVAARLAFANSGGGLLLAPAGAEDPAADDDARLPA